VSSRHGQGNLRWANAFGVEGRRAVAPTTRMRDSDDSVSIGVHSCRFVVELNGRAQEIVKLNSRLATP